MYIYLCTVCGKDFSRLRKRGSEEVCSPCQSNKRVREWKRNNPDKAKQHSGYGGTEEAKKKYAASERGKEVSRIKTSRWYWKDPEHARENNRKNYLKNRDREIQKVINRSERIRKATPAWSDLDAIAELYIEARRLTCETGIEHQVDHIVPLKGKNVSGLHVLNNLRIITAKENKSKGNKIMNNLLTDGNA